MTQNSWNSGNPANVAKGGTGAATLTGILSGNGTSAFTASSVTDNTIVMGSTSNLMQNTTITVTDAGEMVNGSQPAFSAYLASDDDNVSGDDTAYILGTDVALTEIFDQNSDFNTNGTFTAPVTGKYFFVATIKMDTASLATSTSTNFQLKTSNRNFLNTNTDASTDLLWGQSSFNIILDMDASDISQIQINIVGMAGDTADISGSSTLSTYFSGYLVC